MNARRISPEQAIEKLISPEDANAKGWLQPGRRHHPRLTSSSNDETKTLYGANGCAIRLRGTSDPHCKTAKEAPAHYGLDMIKREVTTMTTEEELEDAITIKYVCAVPVYLKDGTEKYCR